MKLKTLGDRMKFFEKEFSLDLMIPELPVIIRIDGVQFKNFTKDLKNLLMSV